MAEPSKNPETPEAISPLEYSKKKGGGVFVIIMLVGLVAYLSSFLFSGTANKFEKERLHATAVVTKVEQREDFLDGLEKTKNTNHHITVHTIVDYEFESDLGERIHNQYTSQDVAEPITVGDRFEISYLASDANVNEVIEGHHQRNTDALRYIALVFFVIPLVIMIWFGLCARRKYNDPSEKRKRRIAELRAKNKKP